MFSKPFIHTFTGKNFYFLDPKPEDICIEDIAHSLSNQCRFAGHSKYFMSIAQHSVMVSEFPYLDTQEKQMWGLLHDASEAYLTDIPTPIKNCLPEYKEMEANLQSIIANKFGLYASEPREVTRADKESLINEGFHMLRNTDYWLSQGKPDMNMKLKSWAPKDAKQFFLDRFYQIQDQDLFGSLPNLYRSIKESKM